MTVPPIRAVLFDMGGTLEELYYDDAIRCGATHGLQERLTELDLDPGLGLPQLQAAVLVGMKAYQAWREKSEVELPPGRVWTEYVFPNFGLSRERLLAAAEELTIYYESRFQVRRLRPEAPAALNALQRQGLSLAIISNIISRDLVPRNLEEYGIAHFFDPVVTSSVFGWRKPNTRIFAEAARLLQLPPAACAYVGDTVARDVVGARRSGYGQVVQIRSFITDQADGPAGSGDAPDQELVPDAVIEDLRQVVDLVCSRRNIQ